MNRITPLGGLAHPHSFLCRYSITVSHWLDVQDRYGNNNELIWDDIKWQELTLEEKLSVLLHFHEQDHIVAFLSTPVGLLLWRCNHILYIGAQWFLKKIEQANVDQISTPIVKWYLHDGGKKQLQNAVYKGNLPKYIDVNKNGTIHRQEIIKKFDSICEELDSIKMLIDIISGKKINSNLTIGSFLDIANTAYKYISIRSDFEHEIKWTTKLNYELKLYELECFGHINALNIFETLARIREEDLLKAVEADQSELNEWKTNAWTDVYNKVYSMSCQQLQIHNFW